MDTIYYLRHEDIKEKQILYHYIYTNMKHNYYYSDDFSPEFYIDLAKAGFLCTALRQEEKEYLIAEMKFETVIMHFENIHISKKVEKLLKKPHLYRFSINTSADKVLESIKSYHENSWIDGKYLEMLHHVAKKSDARFTLMTPELHCTDTGELIAGEVGYRVGTTYTSLSGFSSKEKRYNNYGKLQMTLLCRYLEENGYSFWNMGQPYMQYKFDLGGKLYKRDEFLKMWLKEGK